MRSERRGLDIRRSLVVVRDPVCQSAGRGEMRRHRSSNRQSDRSRRDLSDDPEPGVGRHTPGDGEGNRHQRAASDAVRELRSSFGNQLPPTLSQNRSPGKCESEGIVSTSGHFIQSQRAPTFSTKQRDQSTVEKAGPRDSVSLLDGFWKLQAQVSANRERYERDSKPRFRPVGRDLRQTGKWVEGTEQKSGLKEASQTQKVTLDQLNKIGNTGPLSDTNQCSFVRELPPVSVFVPKHGSIPEEKRAEKASVLVGHINRLSRQKKGALFDVEIIGASDHCPLCGDLNSVCLGVSCRKKKGKRFTFPILLKSLICNPFSVITPGSTSNSSPSINAPPTHCTNKVSAEVKERYFVKVYYAYVSPANISILRRKKRDRVKSFSTKSSVFSWKNSKPTPGRPPAEVLRLRGGGDSPPRSPSPSPPPTRPASPAAATVSSSLGPVRAAASDRSRSGHSRLLSLSPVRRRSDSTQATRSRGRTPGRGKSTRSTPTKVLSQPDNSRGGFVCRRNCNSQFTTDRARSTHETFYCKKSEPQQAQPEIPSSEVPGLSEDVCRVCSKTFSNRSNRLKHEREKHKLVISKDGVIVSPIQHSRHFSCPPQASEPRSVSESMKSRSRQMSSARRNLFSIPSVPMSIASSSASKMSISTVDSSQSILSNDDQLDDNPCWCSSCNHSFSNVSNYNKHVPCRFEVTQEKMETNAEAKKLSPPLQRDVVHKLLQQLSPVDKMKLAISQNWCLQDIWPLVFVGPERSGAGLLREYTANSKSFKLLKMFLSVMTVIELPRSILIVNPENGLNSLLTGSILRPPDESVHVTECEKSFVVRAAGLENTPRKSAAAGDGGGGDDSDGDDGDSEEEGWDDDVSNEDNSIDDESNEEFISYAHQPLQNPFATIASFQDIEHLLPSSFIPGVDNRGQVNWPQAMMTRFRSPWQFGTEDFEKLIHMTKQQFEDFVHQVQGVQTRRWSSDINIFAASLLFLLKMAQSWSFEVLASLFALKDYVHASRIFRRVLIFHFKHCTNLSAIINTAGNLNAAERKKLYREARREAPPYFLTLADALEDPSGNNRIAVPIASDTTYLRTTNSADLEHQKYVFYLPRMGHCTKLASFTSLNGKFLAALPLCASQGSSGDGYLSATHMRHSGYMEYILEGDDEFFVVLYVDAGYVLEARNMPTVLRNVETLVQLCERVNCVLLHTSDNFSTYHFRRLPSGKLEKVPRNDDMITHSENVINFTRKNRKAIEQAHAGLKQKFQIVDCKKLSNSYLQPFTTSQRIKFGLDESFKNVSKLSFVIIVCLSLYNRYHPGFGITFLSQAEQIAQARNCLDRLFIENPLQYDIWDFPLTGRSRQWTEARIGDLYTAGSDVLNFPKCPPHLINPVAVELTGGLNALTTANSVITYKRQLALQGRNMTRDEVLRELETAPDNMTFQFIRVNSEPSGWDVSKFGVWQNLTLIRFDFPPSNKSATSRANFRWPIIALGNRASDRLGLRDPYRNILFWNCRNCPSMCGLLSCDKHTAAAIELLSFKEQYRCTARGIDLLNTVVDDARQVLRSLPSADISAAVPQNIVRRSANTRTYVGGIINPLYDTSMTARAPATGTGTAISTVVTASPPSAAVTTPASAAIVNTVPAAPSSPLSPAVTSTTVSSSSSATAPVASTSGATQRQTGVRNTNLVASPHLRTYLGTIQPLNLPPVPPPSLIVPPNNVNQFAVYHLQSHGLRNVDNCCCVNSLFFALHRMQLVADLPPEDQMILQNNQPDHISLITKEILQAMPCPTFGVQLFLEIWNDIRVGQPMGDNEDILGVSDLFFDHVSLPPQAGVPIITEFLASYNCPCGFHEQDLERWIGKLFLRIPKIQIDQRAAPVPVGELLTGLINTPDQIPCALCGNQNTNGRFRVRRGKFTVINLSRIGNDWPNVIQTRLSTIRTQTAGEQYLGELIACVSHQGNAMGGHYFAYSNVNGSWYQNSDAQPLQRVAYHPFNAPTVNETVNFLVYKNN